MTAILSTGRLAWLFLLPLAPLCADLSDIAPADAEVEKVASGFRFVEGPAWSPRGSLLFSDIPRSRIVQLGGGDRVASFLHPSGKANGLAFDQAGNLYACQGGARQVVRISFDGKISPLATHYDGKRLNSPNDLALDGQGGIYFTDPRYGSLAGTEQTVMGVYYASGGKVVRVIDQLERPNGILVSGDRRTLYVAEPNKRELYSYPILSPGRVGEGHVIFTGDAEKDGGGPDGMALDVEGNIYATYKDIVVLNASGQLLGRIPIPENTANCTFGGADLRTLYVTAQTSLYRVRLQIPGLPSPQFRKPGTGGQAAIRFEAIDLDRDVGIGYGIAAEDMDGDGKPDVVLVDKENVAWYRNPSWEKTIFCSKLTANDHVCIAVRDLDGDKKAEVAVGAAWNPRDTLTSGSVHYLHPRADRSGLWRPVELPSEPTVHRMRWLRTRSGMGLLVIPLHGRGNQGGEGVGVNTYLYRRGEVPSSPWALELVSSQLHMTHNADPVDWDDDAEEEVIIAGREGVFLFDHSDSGWARHQLAGGDGFRGASEVRVGRLPNAARMLASIEPFHGNQVVVYTAGVREGELWRRQVVDDSLKGGHAVACGDLIGIGSDQVVVGWRLPDANGRVGIRLYIPNDTGTSWTRVTVDDNQMACEDLRLADFDDDGRLDIVAAGRATKNLRVYFNRAR